jgi:hypothetical protein
MLFFIIGSSPRTFAISAGVSLLAYCLSALVDLLRGWTLELTVVTLLFTVLGLAVLALTTCRSDPITSLLSHVGRVMSRSLFGPHGAHMHRGEHKAGQAAVDVLPRLQALPIELWKPVASLSVEELVRRLKAMGALPDPRPLERHELENAYAQATESTCAICQEDYQEGDACRMLWPNCRHFYHVECFDRWALPACESATHGLRQCQHHRRRPCLSWPPQQIAGRPHAAFGHPGARCGCQWAAPKLPSVPDDDLSRSGVVLGK